MNQKNADTEENFVKDGRVCETEKSIVCLNQEFKEMEKEEAMKSKEGEEEEEEKCLKHSLTTLYTQQNWYQISPKHIIYLR
jgi:hypothetical protein